MTPAVVVLGCVASSSRSKRRGLIGPVPVADAGDVVCFSLLSTVCCCRYCASSHYSSLGSCFSYCLCGGRRAHVVLFNLSSAMNMGRISDQASKGGGRKGQDCIPIVSCSAIKKRWEAASKKNSARAPDSASLAWAVGGDNNFGKGEAA